MLCNLSVWLLSLNIMHDSHPYRVYRGQLCIFILCGISLYEDTAMYVSIYHRWAFGQF